VKFDPRILIPVALTAGALFIPAGSSTADPPQTLSCPDGFVGPLFIGLAFPNRDKNGNGWLCVKQADFNLIFKDDNCNPNCDKDDVEDNLLTLPDELLDPTSVIEDTEL
jgi:hypothetical protein